MKHALPWIFLSLWCSVMFGYDVVFRESWFAVIWAALCLRHMWRAIKAYEVSRG